MVAMTVVLTAVLYIMVIGMTGSDVGGNRYGDFTLKSVSPTTFDAIFGEFAPDARPIDLKIVVEFENSQGTYVFSSNSDGNLTLERGVDICDMRYEDLSDNAMVSIGDYLRFTNLISSGRYNVYVLDAISGAQIVVQNIDML